MSSENDLRQRKTVNPKEEEPTKTEPEPIDHSFKFVRDEPTRVEWERDFKLLSIVKAFFGLIALNLLLSYFITGTVFWGSDSKFMHPRYLKYIASDPFGHGTRVFTMDELAQYSGRNYDLNNRGEQQILLSFNGTVYDVTENPGSYGPLGGYVFFTGTDATRAFVTGCFKTDLTHDLRGLDPVTTAEIVAGWTRFFLKSPKYWKVGTVILPSVEGQPIPEPCVKGAPQPGRGGAHHGGDKNPGGKPHGGDHHHGGKGHHNGHGN
ncbi:hypothetical protein DV451_002657 [Geotrichum candidum]|uniref:Cytochrome b5 heme-binding domain-containing protein n=1 Tax=Geotrichum candidum TaxID=1173061 RepID=A0A9P5G5R4_GEOCN|nr:hypothetical protein DV451_002657 [Geotrichum candidum]KAF5108036.1 hypothetical protein DV453_002621 [Geotrichum candidum]